MVHAITQGMMKAEAKPCCAHNLPERGEPNIEWPGTGAAIAGPWALEGWPCLKQAMQEAAVMQKFEDAHPWMDAA